MQRTVNYIVSTARKENKEKLVINRTETPVASDDPKCPPRYSNPSLNSVEEWVAIDVIGSGSIRRNTKYNHKFPKNTGKTITVYVEHFNPQSPRKKC